MERARKRTEGGIENFDGERRRKNVELPSMRSKEGAEKKEKTSLFLSSFSFPIHLMRPRESSIASRSESRREAKA